MPVTKFRPSFTFTQDRLAQLQTFVPEAFADGKINWESLKQALGEFLEDENPQAEHFGLFWPGKREAKRLATMPSKGTLVPVPGEGIDEDKTGNIFIEGENLEVLKLLLKSYAGRVKMIYIDPPYNTGNDFVYKDDYKEPLEDYLRKTGQADENGALLTTNAKAGGRFHSNWLNMMYPRLMLARQLLREDGAICVSIGEEELSNLFSVLKEVFGEENYRNTLLIRRYDKNLNRQFMESGLKTLNIGAEYVVLFARGADFSVNPVYREASDERQNFGYWKGFWNAPDRPTMRYELLGVKPETGQWKWKEGTAFEAVQNYREYLQHYQERMTLEEYWKHSGKIKKFIRRNSEGTGKNKGVEHWIPPSSGILRSSNWTDILASETLTSLGLEFDNPKNVTLLKELIRLCCDEDDLIIDFFAGASATTQAVLELNREGGGNRRFIMVQLPEPTPEDSPARKAGYETIAEIGKERIRRVIAKMKKTGNSQERETPEDLGFKVFKLTRSNFKAWHNYDGENIAELEKLFDSAETPLVEDWKEEDLLTEIILQQGFPLDSKKTQQTEFKNNKVTLVESNFCGHRLFICLDGKIKDDTVKRLQLRSEDIWVCLDSALTDQVKMRLSDICKLNII